MRWLHAQLGLVDSLKNIQLIEIIYIEDFSFNLSKKTRVAMAL